MQAADDSHVRLVAHPLGRPNLAIDLRGGEFERAASTVKALILLYALFKNPALAMSPATDRQPASDAYRMIVSSNNGAAARVLADAVGRDHVGQALDAFNDFVHDVLALPASIGLTQWGYYPVNGVTTDRLAEPATSDFPDGIPNPITLDALVSYFEMLETPQSIEAAVARAVALRSYRDPVAYPTNAAYRQAVIDGVARARALMGIPDPDYVTQMDRALAAAQARHPDITFSMYGKNGTISPADWTLNRWHINEAVVVTLAQGERSAKAVVAFSSATFKTGGYLGAALDYVAALFGAGWGEE